MRIYTTLCQLIARCQNRSVHNLDSGTIWNQISLRFAGLIIGHNNLALLLCIVN